jgi:hypothetical protein
MEVPPGLDVNSNQTLILHKTIYCLVQSSREFYKKLIEIFKVIGFIGSKQDPCLWTKTQTSKVLS